MYWGLYICVCVYIYLCLVLAPTFSLCIYVYRYAPPWGLSSLAKELPAAASVMQSSSKELSTVVADRV